VTPVAIRPSNITGTSSVRTLIPEARIAITSLSEDIRPKVSRIPNKIDVGIP